jgi:hypothetical protein
MKLKLKLNCFLVGLAGSVGSLASGHHQQSFHSPHGRRHLFGHPQRARYHACPRTSSSSFPHHFFSSSSFSPNSGTAYAVCCNDNSIRIINASSRDMVMRIQGISLRTFFLLFIVFYYSSSCLTWQLFIRRRNSYPAYQNRAAQRPDRHVVQLQQPSTLRPDTRQVRPPPLALNYITNTTSF